MSIYKEKMVSLPSELNKQALIGALVKLSFNLTVAARNTYLAGTDDVENPRGLRGISEINHRTLSQAMHLLNDTKGAPYEGFVTQIFEISAHYGCVIELENAMEFSFFS